MANRPLRVGVIGAGGIGRSEHLPYWKKCPFAEVAAVCDADTARAEEAVKQFGGRAIADWKDLIKADLDIVDITTPNVFHAPMTVSALEAGKHVFCEKPMATSAADARRMLEASKAAGKLLMINHHLRFAQSITGLRALVGEKGLGEVYHATAKWTRRRGVPPAPTFLRAGLAGGGPIMDLGVHLLDLAMWLMDFPRPTRVSAQTSLRLATRDDVGGMWGDDWDRAGFEVEDGGIGLFHFEGGATLLLEANWMSFQPEPETRQLSIFGTKGGVHWPQGVYCAEADRVPIDARLQDLQDVRPHERSLLAFAAAVRDGRPSPIPPEQSLVITSMIEAFYASARSGREVTIEF